MFSSLFSFFGYSEPKFKQMSVLSPEALSEQLMNVVYASGSPQKDFERRTIGSSYDNSTISMAEFREQLVRDDSELLPVSRMEVEIELKCEGEGVRWEIKNIWSRTPANTQYLVNESDIQTQLSSRQASDQKDEVALFLHQAAEEPMYVEALKAERILEGATLDSSFLHLKAPMENQSRSKLSYESWLDHQFSNDGSAEAMAIKAELKQVAAQSLYNLFIFHLLTSVSEDGTEYRPGGLIPQTTIHHHAATHMTTLVLSACAMSEERFDPENPMNPVRRFYHKRDELIEVTDEDPRFEHLTQVVRQVNQMWMHMNEPTVQQTLSSP